MFKEKLAIIIPTKDRPGELKRLLESIAGQEVKPVQVIVVDGGSKELKGVLNSCINLDIEYIKKNPPSLTSQRNTGIKMLKEEASLVVFFDDDVVLQRDSLLNMMKFWDIASKDTAGAAFNLVNFPSAKVSFLEKIFLVNSEAPGRILRSGFQNKVNFLNKTLSADWLSGCAMVWRKNIFNEFRFDEWFGGYAHYEDVDFSYRISRKYKIFIVKDAQVIHKTHSIDQRYEYALGKMQVTNRIYFVRKHPELSVILCYWACLGLLSKNLFMGIMQLRRKYFLRGLGVLSGMLFSFIRLEKIQEKIK